MKVLITGCSNENYWYKDEIGNIFEIAEGRYGDAIPKYPIVGKPYSIDKQDCHIIQSIGTVLTEWDKNGGELELWGQNFKTWIKIEDGHNFLFCLNSILRIKPIEQPQYRPYTFEEAKEVFTKDAWMIDKQTGELLMVFRIKEDGVFLASCPKTEYNLLLSNFNHLDGRSCGVKIN